MRRWLSKDSDIRFEYIYFEASLYKVFHFVACFVIIPSDLLLPSHSKPAEPRTPNPVERSELPTSTPPPMPKILVTGADGFIGSHLCEYLVHQGHQVRTLVWYNSFGQNGWLDSLDEQIRSELEIVTGDIRDGTLMRNLAQDCEWIMHLAALIGIPYSYRAPESYIDTNVKGTLNLLEAARTAGCSKVLITSTSEVYGSARYVPIDEKHPLQPQSPYSASKIGADSLAISYAHSFEVPVTVVRPFNTYGPRQSNRAIIPTIITQLLSGAASLKLGDLRPTRDLLFVEDNVRAYQAIAEAALPPGTVVNVATGAEVSMQQVADTLIDQIRPGTPIVADPERIRPPKSEVRRLCGDASRLKELTNWEPQFDLSSGLAKTIEWYHQHPDRWQNGSRYQV